MPDLKLILASSSPRRQELIQLFGRPWETIVADVDESSVDHPDPATNVVRTARLKADAVAARTATDAVIIAADTTVALAGEMLNKPADAEDARRMLKRVRGRVHQVHTGIVVVNTSSGRSVADVATVDVPMRDYSDEEIERYIATGDPLDKAGAYAIQHAEFRPVSGLAGCYSAVVGLPLCHLTRALRKVGLEVSDEIAWACQDHHHYDCPIFQEILA